MTGSEVSVVCGFWPAHNMTRRAEGRANSVRARASERGRKPHGSPRCNHFDYNRETAPRNAGKEGGQIGDCSWPRQLQSITILFPDMQIIARAGKGRALSIFEHLSDTLDRFAEVFVLCTKSAMRE